MARPKFRLAVANRPYDCSCVSQFWPNVTGRRYFADNIDLSSTTVNFNGLLYGVSATVIRRLQMVLNAAARFVVGAGKFQHITPVLRNVVHWLPVRQWILYKVAATAFDCIRGTGPAYFKHVCMPVGHTSVLLNAATCWFLTPELSSADGVFQLLHRPSGTLFRHICARH